MLKVIVLLISLVNNEHSKYLFYYLLLFLFNYSHSHMINILKKE